MRKGTVALLPLVVVFFSIAAFLGVMYFALPTEKKAVVNTNVGDSTNVTAVTNVNSVSTTNVVLEENSGSAKGETNENTNTVSNTNSTQGLENIKNSKSPIKNSHILESDLFSTPYNRGDVSQMACNDEYCLMASSSAGWVYHLVKYEKGTFIDLTQQIDNFQAPYQFQPRWNGQYWLIPYGNEVLKYDGQHITVLKIPGNVAGNACNVTDVVWNEKTWMLMTMCTYANSSGGVILEYDGTTFWMKTSSYPGVTRLAWNGQEWAFAGQKVSASGSATPVTTVFVTFDGTNWKDYSSQFSTTAGLSVSAIVWRGQSWWVSFQSGPGQPTSHLYSFDGSKLTDQAGFLRGFKDADVGHLLNDPIFTIGAYRNKALNIVQGGQTYDLSAYLPSDVMSLARQSSTTLLVGLDQGRILQLELSQ